jgi:ABC-type Zn uptake system ZnuABC Zn-binding protein ZnuA
VKLIILESFYNRAIADDVATKTSAVVVSAPSDVGARPEIKTYYELVDALLDGLVKAAAK